MLVSRTYVGRVSLHRTFPVFLETITYFDMEIQSRKLYILPSTNYDNSTNHPRPRSPRASSLLRSNIDDGNPDEQ